MKAYCINYRNACLFILFINVLGAAGQARLFEPGTGQRYQLAASVVLNEAAGQKAKEVGYQVRGDVVVGAAWRGEEDGSERLLEVEVSFYFRRQCRSGKLLPHAMRAVGIPPVLEELPGEGSDRKIKLIEPKLLIMSRKSPTPEGFDVHKSYLEQYVNFPFLVHWKNGKVVELYVDEREEKSLVDFKKGLASLFQFQVLDLETKETDTSGHCTVYYKSLDPFSFTKTKTNCSPPPGLQQNSSADGPLGPAVASSRVTTFTLSQDLSALESVSAFEHHDLRMVIRKEAGSSVSSSQTLTLTKKNEKTRVLESRSVEAAVKEFEKARKLKMSKQNLDLGAFAPKCDKEDCPSLATLIKDNRQHLSAASLGSLKSASAFLRLLWVARTATKEELARAFKGAKNKEILAQLCDLAGAVQTPEAHEVITKIINFDAEDDLDNSERYLWSLATGSHPHESVVKDIFKISQRPHPNEKITETLVLTLASMANRLRRIPGKERSSLLRDISDSILGELELCKDEQCKLRYLRALRNLLCPRTIPALVRQALHAKKKVAVEAVKCLRSFDPAQWSPEVIDAAQRIYFQVGKRFDSSSRTLALDILLESNPRREVLQEVLLSLGQRDSAYEVHQYLVQRVRQISEKNLEFANQVISIKKEFPRVFRNYNTQAQRGLTTAFGREFASDELRNGSLETVLEISNGLLKRGMVDVVVEAAGKTTNLFRLGLFAGGLTSFVSSDDENESKEDSEEETATAGMELSVMGAHLRPFVFFNGQGELMGHVWSGTGSEKTSAYQALLLAIDYRRHIPLQVGFVAQVEVLGGVSFDLSGQIQISLWSRNAHSLVEKNAGISLQGRVRVDASFVKSKVEFNTGTEVKLNLQSDLNFYSGAALCMQLSQPEVVIRQSIHKIESIPGGKHRLRKSKYTQVVVPGRTYALNRKNDEICSSIFNN